MSSEAIQSEPLGAQYDLDDVVEQQYVEQRASEGRPHLTQ
jgi:hypothetical protein